MSTETLAQRDLRANGIWADPAPGPGRHWATRVLRSPWTWVTLGATLIFAACLGWMYWTVTRDVPVRDGVIPGLNFAAIRRAAGLALPTLAVWLVLFVWLDRYRPSKPLLWYLALGWGACVSTAASMQLNTWASQEMAITGDGDPTQGARAAVFVAPFVEEATKATVLFLIAIAVRYRVVSKLQAVALAGLSAAGFAFTENILYYSRVIVYASVTIEAGDPEQALAEIVRLRGLITAFGHPLFTIMTGLGLVIALRTRSKVVRILSPLIGFLAAAGLHMLFNFVASVGGQAQPLLYFTVALPLVAFVAFHAITQVLVEGRRHTARLADYVMMGWLPDTDVRAFSRQRTRWASVLISLTYGWRALVATVSLQRVMSELVYLRDAQVRGTIDAAGHLRERALLDRAAGLRVLAITDPRTQKVQLPQLPAFLRRRPRAPQQPLPPRGPPGQPPVTTGASPVGSPQYSPVDPRWGPPKG